jgi:hypothetical protein
MKNLFILFVTAILSINIYAQSPEKMSYQAVVRDASNGLVANSAVGMQISILQGGAAGTAVYVETQMPTTNDNGLVSLEIGGGTSVSGSFSAINWGAGPYFIKTETDPSGGTNYSISGTSQMMSVPYAMYANTADHVVNDAVNDADSDPANEIQTLSRNGNTISLSNGGGTFTDNVGQKIAGPGITIHNDTISLATRNVEDLVMIQGTFNKTGTKLGGAGYTIVRDTVGMYTLTFDKSFGGFPAVTYSTNWTNTVVLTNVLSYGWATIVVRDTKTGALVDPNAWISFIAVGRKQ